MDWLSDRLGGLADVTRLSDGDETEVSLALSGGLKSAGLRAYFAARGISRPCLLVLGWYGPSEREIFRRRSATMRLLRGSGGVRLGRALGETWRQGRFGAPRQRDDVRKALSRELGGGHGEPIVMCHISHTYGTGASLYFTVLAARDDDDPFGQWQCAKEAASAAVGAPLGYGGRSLRAITHHHAGSASIVRRIWRTKSDRWGCRC